jgi:6-phosphofructokinase 1
MRIGVLTGGGDCPGLNAVIRAVVRRSAADGHSLVGFRGGWRGVVECDVQDLSVVNTRGILPRGGTILGTTRLHPFMVPDGLARALDTLAREGVDALVAIGGEGTLAVSHRMHQEGVPVVGVPKTIDNDVRGTDVTFGFQTAVQIATDAIDRLHTTAESHDRVMLVEVMGRHAGWIAAYAGMAGGADVILVPEQPFDLDEVCRRISHRHRKGSNFSIVVVAEGAVPKEGTMPMPPEEVDEYGHVRLGGIAERLRPQIEMRTGFETRVTILGHVQRGGTPTAADRVLATRYGVHAADAAIEGDYGMMVASKGLEIVRVPLSEVCTGTKVVPERILQTASVFFG